MSPLFTWPERRTRSVRRESPMADDASITRRVNPFARSTDHRKLDAMLDQWSIWIRTGGLEQFHVGAIGFWSHGNSDVETMENWADNVDAVTMDACIWDLVPIERSAVMNFHCEGAAVFRSNRGEKIEDVYVRARGNLSEGLRKRRVD